MKLAVAFLVRTRFFWRLIDRTRMELTPFNLDIEQNPCEVWLEVAGGAGMRAGRQSIKIFSLLATWISSMPKSSGTV